jgi:hypothetical protein
MKNCALRAAQWVLHYWAADMDQARRAFLLREYERGATDELSEESAAALYCVVRRQ